MDYKLAALKLTIEQLKRAKPNSSSAVSGYTLGGDDGILFQRAWLHGVVVSVDEDNEYPRLLLDDGTGIAELQFSNYDFLRTPWQTGMYVMVVGSFVVPHNKMPIIKIHKIVDLSSLPHREPMWYLEVIEAHRIFYRPFA